MLLWWHTPFDTSSSCSLLSLFLTLGDSANGLSTVLEKGFPLLTPQCFSPHLGSLRVLLPFLRFLNGWSIKSHSKTFKAFLPWTLWHRKTCFMSFKISPLDSDVNIFYLKSEHCCQFIIVGFLTFRSNFLFRRSIESHELLWIHIPAFAATREWLYYIHTKNIYVNNKLLLLLL